MRIAEMLRTLDISGFKRSGIMKHDVERFCNEYAHFSTNNPFMVGLRLAFGDTITVHTITGGVCGKIRNTRIEHLPNGQPAFLKKPFLLEAQKGESLINNIHTIGGYIDEESNLIIISWFTDGSFLVQREAYAFVGMSLSDLEFTNATDYEAGGKSENKNTLLFITILALMLEAERTPIQVSDTSGVKKNKHNKPAKNESNGWIERRIYIDTRYKSDAAKGDHKPFDKEGKRLEKVYIQGFLRNQPYGAGQKLRKWIYVEGFASTRWKREGDTRVIVSMRNQKGDSH